MNLEKQFFQYFFYPFLLGMTFSVIVVITCSVIFTNNFIDTITGKNMLELDRDNSKININSINAIISTSLLKVELVLNEMVLYYQNIAKKVKLNEPNLNLYIDDDYLKCVLDFDETINKKNTNTSFMAYWLLDLETNLFKLKTNADAKNQLITLSNMIQNMFSVYYSTNETIQNFYFYFESTELFASFPLLYSLEIGFIEEILNFTKNPVWCTDKNGEIYKFYKTKCRGFYNNIKKAKSDIFDINYKDNENRTLFITDFFLQTGIESEIVFATCLEFTDPISNKLAYLCSDTNENDLNYNFDNINLKLSGYFFINSVGFVHPFYFPQKIEEGLTVTENIYERNKKFFLSEKTYFSNNIQKLMSSNYIKYINDSLYSEIYTNGKNKSEQIFYINGEKYEFSIYPIVLENFNGKKEHVLSVIHVYNNKLFYQETKIKANLGVSIILQLIIIIIFGSGLLYLIVLSFNTLAKYIVIPIKNVNYMLKGINIGGKNRLEYLNHLKKRQDENAEMLEKLYLEENDKKNNKDNDNDELNNDIKEDNNQINNKNDLIEDSPLIDKNENIDKDNENGNNDTENNNEIIDSNVNNYQKYEEENDFIEKETVFYNFNEELLQFRPLEIDHLVKELIELKRAVLLISSEQQVDNIINYSNSEEIFRSFKNNEGTTICQSNIGNLQSQLFKYDKAIYHLAISLQDSKLKKFLDKNIYDELDDSDTLLDKIFLSFNIQNTKIFNNLLIERQQNNTRGNFSQKIIGILINSRYNKLIHFYYKFFSLIQKLDSNTLNGRFMNTSFHNINYYHKIIIQYIYLCFVKNDLVKIGESILDYITFLIKFKFKTTNENKYICDIRNKEQKKLSAKQRYKKTIFNKILNWFNLFEEYIFYVRNNTTLSEEKSLFEDYSINSNDELNSGSQSIFLFKINLQRAEFLRGKFASMCNNYTDALFFFIRAAKKESIVLDGLIKKKSLKRIFKIIQILSKKYNDYNIIRWKMEEKLKEYERTKIRHFFKKAAKNINIDKIQEKISLENKNSFKKEFMIIEKNIMNDLEESNIKQTKDVIIIIDFNLYEQGKKNIFNNNKLDSFINQTKNILNDYLSDNDRLSIFIYKTQYQIICPLLEKNKLDFESFLKDLTYYKKNVFNELEEDEYISLDEQKENGLEKEKLEFELENKNLSESESQESSNKCKQTKIEDIVKGLINSINYTETYLKIKEIDKNEKYIILFTDIFNNYKITDEIINTNFKNLKEVKDITFLLVGRNKRNDIKNDKNILYDLDDENKMFENIIQKFGKKSELIDYENMKKIQNILSSNNTINDEIIYPNEIYK